MSRLQKAGLLIAAPSSGSGKTVVTLALLRAFKNLGIDISSAKAGPDYIDPGFHEVASGHVSLNLDPWAMNGITLMRHANSSSANRLLIEGMMGLFDGAADGSGSAASLSKLLKVPAILVVDASKQSHSIAALIRGFRDHDSELSMCGVILNKVGSARHEVMLRRAIQPLGLPVFGAIPRDDRLVLPERHLGLVQAQENAAMDCFIEEAAALVESVCDLQAIQLAFSPIDPEQKSDCVVTPLGQRIAVARDNAFSFCYPHMMKDWRETGAEISFFSPLANEEPNRDVDAVFLPGGYPELYAEQLANADQFKIGLKQAFADGKLIYGECGGYMVLGDALVDAEGKGHAMAGLLALETSFQKRKLHLGYREIEAQGFVMGNSFKGHEFHYTTAMREEGESLFKVKDALGADLGTAGLRSGMVMGSYMHIIDRATV